MLATEILKRDHRDVENLMAQLEKAKGHENGMRYRPIFESLQMALQKHMMVEEEIFYPLLRNADDFGSQVVDSYDEHAEVKALLAQMNELNPSTKEFQQVLATMKSDIELHIVKEESDMFPIAEAQLGRERMEEIGKLIRQAKIGTRQTVLRG
jgi:Regulator of cell morphogenesis and NO signaling